MFQKLIVATLFSTQVLAGSLAGKTLSLNPVRNEFSKCVVLAALNSFEIPLQQFERINDLYITQGINDPDEGTHVLPREFAALEIAALGTFFAIYVWSQDGPKFWQTVPGVEREFFTPLVNSKAQLYNIAQEDGYMGTFDISRCQ